MPVTCDMSAVFPGYSCFLHKENWKPRNNWNIVQSGVKHHSPNPIQTVLTNYSWCWKDELSNSQHDIILKNTGNSTKIKKKTSLEKTITTERNKIIIKGRQYSQTFLCGHLF